MFPKPTDWLFNRITFWTQDPNQTDGRQECKSGKRHTMVASAFCTVDNENCFLCDFRIGPKSFDEKHVSVKSIVTSCDLTFCATTYISRVQQACLLARCAEKISKNLRLLTCVDHSTRRIHDTRIQWFIATRRHCAIRQVSTSISAVPIRNIDLNLWNRSRPCAFVPISFGFTSEWEWILCECVSFYDLLFVSLLLCVLCCCMLWHVSGMIVISLWR